MESDGQVMAIIAIVNIVIVIIIITATNILRDWHLLLQDVPGLAVM